ncbi:MAG TPA: PKD domain-containing protein, partial [Nannocystaceae bacterium]|nr:PKD domain-containing protein [Nannocystaceae bacterium]
MRRLAWMLVLSGCRSDAVPVDASTSSSSTSTANATSSESSSSAAPEPSSESSSSSTTGDDGPLTVHAGADRYALVGEVVVLDGSASTGASSYQWFLDDGSPLPRPGADPIAMVAYDEPGRYRPVLTVFDDDGTMLAGQVTISVTRPPSHVPRQSASIAVEPGGDRIAVVSPDSDELAIASVRGESGFAIAARHGVCEGPRTLAWLDERIAVACPQGGVVQLVDATTGDTDELALPRASRPFG